MEFQQFRRPSSGCASYLIGSPTQGVCAVVDPAWEVEQYLAYAEQQGLRITHVLETHAHADHLSGARKLAERTGAAIYVHSAFGAAFPHHAVEDGEVLEVGDLRVSVLHTPGHRPDSVCYAVADTSRAAEPWLVLTGDTLFIGDVGRPDLGAAPEEQAAQLYDSLFRQLLTLPDSVEVYPAHYAGSPCGKAMSHKPVSTIGFERRFNQALQAHSKEEFVREVAGHVPAQPPNFDTIVRKNQGVLPIRAGRPVPLSARDVLAKRDGGSLIVDLRAPREFGAGFIPEAVNVPLRYGHFPSAAGWGIPPEEPLVLVLERDEELPEAVDALTSAGLDWMEGFLHGGMESWRQAGLETQGLAQLTAKEVHTVLGGDLVLVDVRTEDDWAAGHIPGARSVPLMQLDLAELPADRPIAFVCGSGITSGIAASKAAGYGYNQVYNMAGGVGAWERAGYGLERAPVHARRSQTSHKEEGQCK